MYAEGGVKARCRKNAEALDNAEIRGGDRLHAKRADQHHAESDGGADTVRAAAAVLPTRKGRRSGR